MTPNDDQDRMDALRGDPRFAGWFDDTGGAEPQQQPTDAAGRARLRARGLALVYLRLRMRDVATFVKAWDTCGRPACRRARACRSASVACFDEWSEEIRDRLQQLVDWDRFDEPPTDEDLDYLAADLRRRGAPV